MQDPCDWPIDNMVVLADLEPEQHSVPEVQSHVDKAEPRSLTSICGGFGDQGLVAAELSEPDLVAEPLSSRGSAALGVPSAIAGEESTVRSAVDSKPMELKGRLWDPADPPRQTHSAWQTTVKRDTEVNATHGTKTRFPARLPPLSGFTTKGLRKTGSTPVLQVRNLPEPGP